MQIDIDARALNLIKYKRYRKRAIAAHGAAAPIEIQRESSGDSMSKADKIWRDAVLMYMQEVKVNNKVGLHARPATYFIQKANEFKSGIWIEKNNRRVNAKSLLGVLSLGIVQGTEVHLIADGNDEKEAVAALAELVSTNFAE